MTRRILNKLFYSIFVRVGKQYGGEEYPLITALLTTLLLSVTSFSLLLSALFVINYWFDISVFPFFPNWLYYGIVSVLMLLYYFLFIHKKRYLSILSDYKEMDGLSRRKKTLSYFLFFLFASFSLVIVGFVYLFFLK